MFLFLILPVIVQCSNVFLIVILPRVPRRDMGPDPDGKHLRRS